MIKLSITSGKGSKMQIIVSLCLEVNLLSQAILLIQLTKTWLWQCVPSCKDTLEYRTPRPALVWSHISGLGCRDNVWRCSFPVPGVLSHLKEGCFSFVVQKAVHQKLKLHQKSKFLQPVCLKSLHTWSSFRKGSVKKTSYFQIINYP